MVFIHKEDMDALLPKTCPPEKAISKDVDPVYRFIENEKVEPIDFKSHKEREMKYPSYQECGRLAISFYTSEEAVEKALQRFPFFRDKKVASGKITSSCGKLFTKNGHINLWLYKGVDMVRVFTREEKNGEEE